MGQVLPYINISFILISACCVAIGWCFIRLKKVDWHRRWMLAGSFFAAAFFIGYVAKTILFGDTTFGGPTKWKVGYEVFLQTHSTLATIAAIMGIASLYLAFRKNFRKHKRIGPWTASLWFLTAATGLVVFLLLYIVFPPGSTTSIFHDMSR